MTTENLKQTRHRFAVIGNPIGHSLSPLMHRHWIHQQGLDACYEKLEIAPGDLEKFVKDAPRAGFTGFNVTIPHKETIIPFLDKIAPQVRRIGAVNTVRIDGGITTGFNTDGIGFLAPLKAINFDFRRPVLLVGAGGAARAILSALLLTDVPIVMISNRSRDRAYALVNSLGSGRASIVDGSTIDDAVAAAGLIINSTSLGMKDCGELSLDLTRAARDAIIYDIVYNPLATGLINSARDLGLRTIDGLDMLIHQGAASFKIWTGLEVDTAGLREILKLELGNKP